MTYPLTLLAIATLTSSQALAADQDSDKTKTRTAKPALVPEQILKQYDLNMDGKLSPQEWAAIPGMEGEKQGHGQKGDRRGDGAKGDRREREQKGGTRLGEFQKFDANRDSFVSREELAARAGHPPKTEDHRR